MIALALVALSGWAGALCLASAMSRHQRDLFGRTLPQGQTRTVRWAGWLLVVAAGVIAVTQWGWAMGLVFWFSLAPLAALTSVLIITLSAERGGWRATFRKSPSPSPAARPQAESLEP